MFPDLKKDSPLFFKYYNPPKLDLKSNIDPMSKNLSNKVAVEGLLGVLTVGNKLMKNEKMCSNRVLKRARFKESYWGKGSVVGREVLPESPCL